MELILSPYTLRTEYEASLGQHLFNKILSFYNGCAQSPVDKNENCLLCAGDLKVSVKNWSPLLCLVGIHNRRRVWSKHQEIMSKVKVKTGSPQKKLKQSLLLYSSLYHSDDKPAQDSSSVFTKSSQSHSEICW